MLSSRAYNDLPRNPPLFKTDEKIIGCKITLIFDEVDIEIGLGLSCVDGVVNLGLFLMFKYLQYIES